MKRSFLSVFVGVVGLAGGVLGLSALSAANPVETYEQPGDPESTWYECGGYCGDIWYPHQTCHRSQRCCGYIFCPGGGGQSTCCPPGQLCTVNLTSSPPSYLCYTNNGFGP